MGVLGTAATLSAAYEFAHHQHARNKASGTLDEKATVTQAEMIEHAFYQVLNLVQIVYLHALPHVESRVWAALLCALATSPWLVRSRLPVHSFSKNYKEGVHTWTQAMYRVKKWQYVFYKHALLHGLNLSAALLPAVGSTLTGTLVFKTYWLALNTSYVMEFFLQTLVKRRHLSQQAMLCLNALLMAASSVVAFQVLTTFIGPVLAVVSLVLNFAHRGHDFLNTTVILSAALLLR